MQRGEKTGVSAHFYPGCQKQALLPCDKPRGRETGFEVYGHCGASRNIGSGRLLGKGFFLPRAVETPSMELQRNVFP